MFASATVAPRSIAASVGFNPTAPLIAAITQSAGRCAASIKASSPAAASMPRAGKRVFEITIGGRISDYGVPRADLARDFAERRGIAPRADCIDAITFRVTLDQVERAGTDRAGRSENSNDAHDRRRAASLCAQYQLRSSFSP